MEHAFTIRNGNHPAENAPVCVTLEGVDADADSLQLTDAATGRLTAHQAWRCPNDGALRVAWIAESLAPAETRRMVLTDQPKHPWSDRVVLTRTDEGTVDVAIDGQPFTAYRHGPDVVRPYCHPVIGPYGESLTRAYPMIEGVEGELTDHHHHKAFYVAHGDVGGADDWSETPDKHGYVITRDVQFSSGPVFGQIDAVNDWVDHARDKKCEERRRYRFWATPAAGRMIDLTVTFVASEGELTFGDTKEGGICALRLRYHSKVGSVITSPTGAVTAEGTPDETWGQRFHWLDHSGPVAGQWVGAAIMDTPGNFRYPTYWHVRTNGMMTANPFGLSYYFNDKSIDGSHTIPAGAELSFQYRVYFHAGDVNVGKVADKYNNYVFGPKVTG